MKAFKGLFILWGCVMLFASGAGSAAPIVLLDLNFDAVPGLASRTSVVSGEALLAWLPPGSAAGSPEGDSWVNVRRHDNAIDGTSSGESTVHFDNFYTSGNFLVIGDQRGDLRGSEAGTSQLLVPFGIPAGSRALAISFDWVFDTTDDAGANADDFDVHLLAGGTERELLSIGRPEHNGATRGVFSLVVGEPYPGGTASLRLRLTEGSGDGSSAVGLDNLRVVATVPETGTLSLVAAGLMGLLLRLSDRPRRRTSRTPRPSPPSPS
ncbi:MAG: hypothetical protein AB1830_15735 [Pseudomonadota bacterium]